MKLRIALWSLVGLLISVCWFVYATQRAVPIWMGSLQWKLAEITQPILLAGYSRHHAMAFYWVFLANALTYGAIGLVFESFRRRNAHAL